jgi:hypothetical protein
LSRPTPKDEYGLFTEVPEAPEYPAREKYQAHLLEQYKLYVEMADRVSQRRQTTNSYFLSINSALLAFVGYITTKGANESAYLWLVGAAGIVLSVLWFQIITSYRNLNTAKFNLLHAIEARLPLNLYKAEWDYMGRGTNPRRYKPLSHIEQVVPWIFVALHLYVVIHSLFFSAP